MILCSVGDIIISQNGVKAIVSCINQTERTITLKSIEPTQGVQRNIPDFAARVADKLLGIDDFVNHFKVLDEITVYERTYREK